MSQKDEITAIYTKYIKVYTPSFIYDKLQNIVASYNKEKAVMAEFQTVNAKFKLPVCPAHSKHFVKNAWLPVGY